MRTKAFYSGFVKTANYYGLSRLQADQAFLKLAAGLDPAAIDPEMLQLIESIINQTGEQGMVHLLPGAMIAQLPANDANDFMSYRGIEDFYADSWLCIDGVNVQGWQYFVNTSNAPNTFASDTFTGAYVATGVSVPSASNAFIKTCHESLQNGFIPTALGGSATTYFGDALWSAGGNHVLYFGGNAAYGASCGASCVAVNAAASTSSVGIGAALCR